MRVGHVCTFDISGGASRAAYRLHRGLVDAGIDSTMFVGTKASDDPTVQLVSSEGSAFAKLRRRFRYGMTARQLAQHAKAIANGHDVFSSDRIPGATRVAEHLAKCDIVHLHWISWFVDWEDFFYALPGGQPIVWTLHDMNTFTGGCHYDAGCGRFRSVCGICPALESARVDDLSRQIFQRKSAIFESLPADQLRIITPSAWLGNMARESALLRKFQVQVIPYGLDTTAYHPIDRTTCRHALHVPVDAKAVLFVADSNQNKRKGFTLLVEALKLLKDVPNLVLMSIGGAAQQVMGDVPHVWIGQIRDDQKLATVYSAADVLVIPSLQDNLPNTVLEAMACGTPAVGFDIGGIPDMIQDGATGFLAPPRDVVGLAQAIRKALSDEYRGRMSGACRNRAVKEYDQKVQAQRYIEIYEQMSQTPDLRYSQDPDRAPAPKPA